jgi:hypothetical protein
MLLNAACFFCCCCFFFFFSWVALHCMDYWNLVAQFSSCWIFWLQLWIKLWKSICVGMCFHSSSDNLSEAALVSESIRSTSWEMGKLFSKVAMFSCVYTSSAHRAAVVLYPTQHLDLSVLFFKPPNRCVMTSNCVFLKKSSTAFWDVIHIQILQVYNLKYIISGF